MAQAQFPLLRSSFSIGRLTVPNRIVMPAMGVNLGALGGGVSDDLIAYYEARARGGVGLIISEVTRVVDGAGAGEPCQLAARNHSDIPDLQRLVDTIHKYPTKFFIQLQHPGAMSSPAVTGTLPVIPSLPSPEMKDFLHVLTIEECEALVAAFIQGATIAQAAGADGVELHGAHGYLINQFLSPTYNKRDDKYGGSFKGRMRFLTEIIEGIRASCGPNFALSVRVNAEEEFPGGSKLKDAQKIAAALEKLGIDLINVTCMGAGTIEPGTYEQGWKRYMASAIKEVVSIPVLAVSNIKRPEIAEQLLADGICDLVGVARGHLADPQWSAKALEGRADEIRPCIGCLACFDEICKLHRVKCAINPVTGREREFEFIVEDGFGRPVAIVGGGPAGIEAALALEERGFAPVIFEKGDRLGGALNIADKGIGKSFITAYIDFLIEEVERSGIEV
ncbi:MAG: NAD(P)-binding protein, partial [Actinomycetia bacterium]|nr:NAD(P)-binding protein [Actinomycetes bacterium]